VLGSYAVKVSGVLGEDSPSNFLNWPRHSVVSILEKLNG